MGVEDIFAGKRHSAVLLAKPTADNEERKLLKRAKLFQSMAAVAGSGDENMSTGAPNLQQEQQQVREKVTEIKSPARRGRVTRKSLTSREPMKIDDGEMPRVHKDVYVWGYNAYGELGLGKQWQDLWLTPCVLKPLHTVTGDTSIRLTPTVVTALQHARVRSLSLGDR